MLKGFYTAATGMLAQQRSQEAMSNNLTNANTPGYKADTPALRAFPELLMHEMSSKSVPGQNSPNLPVQNPIGSLNTGVYAQETIPDFVQGDLKETGNATDMALVHGDLPDEEGSLFFTVQDENGEERLTKNGSFTVDGEGFLTTSEGYYVLDEDGSPVQTDGMEFTVTPEGLLDTGEMNVQLGIGYTDDANTLTKEGDGLYAGDSQAPPAEAAFSIKQGFLEQSNVDPQTTMTEMMEGHRLFETNQRVLKAYDESMDQAVNQVGRLG